MLFHQETELKDALWAYGVGISLTKNQRTLQFKKRKATIVYQNNPMPIYLMDALYHSTPQSI